MKAVGLRELKNRLSEFVRDVRRGERVLVTDRGEVVAELVPPGQRADDGGVTPGIRRLVDLGLATISQPSSPGTYPALPPAVRPGTAAELLDAERGPR